MSLLIVLFLYWLVFQANPCLMKPWIILSVLGLLVVGLSTLHTATTLASLGTMAAHLVALALGAWALAVVWAHKEELEEQKAAAAQPMELIEGRGFAYTK